MEIHGNDGLFLDSLEISSNYANLAKNYLQTSMGAMGIVKMCEYGTLTFSRENGSLKNKK